MNLLEKVEAGVSTSEMSAFQRKYMLTHKQMAYLLAISEKGYYNLLNKDSLLSKNQSGQFLKVVEVFKEGEEALMSKEAFLEWLQQPHWYFKHRKPFDLLDTPIGADAIIEELGRAKYGMLS
jgi:putative toxin-antitoxin system antitoxin component (TIGR02293 family)